MERRRFFLPNTLVVLLLPEDIRPMMGRYSPRPATCADGPLVVGEGLYENVLLSLFCKLHFSAIPPVCSVCEFGCCTWRA